MSRQGFALNYCRTLTLGGDVDATARGLRLKLIACVLLYKWGANWLLLFYSTPHTISLNHHRISCSQCAKAFGVDHKQGCMTEYQARLLEFPKDNVDRGFNSVGRIEGISEIFTLKIVAINSMVIPSFFSLLKNLLETCRFTYFSAFINRLFPHTLQSPQRQYNYYQCGEADQWPACPGGPLPISSKSLTAAREMGFMRFSPDRIESGIHKGTKTLSLCLTCCCSDSDSWWDGSNQWGTLLGLLFIII